MLGDEAGGPKITFGNGAVQFGFNRGVATRVQGFAVRLGTNPSEMRLGRSLKARSDETSPTQDNLGMFTVRKSGVLVIARRDHVYRRVGVNMADCLHSIPTSRTYRLMNRAILESV